MSHSVYVLRDTVLACSGLIQLTVPLALETLPSVLSRDFFAIPKSISLATPFWYLQQQRHVLVLRSAV
jgi:hypothetical protein